MNYKTRRSNKRKSFLIFITLFFFILPIFFYFYVYLLANPQDHTFIFPLTSEPIANPLMGWAPWATIEAISQPHSLVYADLTWREFEPREGVFNFKEFEEENQLPRWRNEGKRVVFRFVLDKPGDQEHLDIPDWLYEKIGGDGDFYDNTYGSGFSPNYSNQTLIEYHRKAITELGNRYSKNNFFVYIELGSLGHWGEWHITLDTGIRPLPPESVRDKYVHHYIEAFPNTHLLLRRPFSIAAQLNLGLYNDMTAENSATRTWLDWIESGGEYSQTGEINGLVSMPDGWKVAPIGGEQATAMSVEEIYGENIDQTIQLLKNSHTTFIGPAGPIDPEEAEGFQEQIDRVLSTIGYRLYIDQFEIQQHVRFCNEVEGRINFGNNGIAPIYYNWPTIVYIFGENQIPVYSLPIGIDLRKITPGDLVEVGFSLPLNHLSDGIYTIGLAIVDPINNQPAVKFAMKNDRPDLIFELGSFEIERSDLGMWLSRVPGICNSK